MHTQDDARGGSVSLNPLDDTKARQKSRVRQSVEGKILAEDVDVETIAPVSSFQMTVLGKIVTKTGLSWMHRTCVPTLACTNKKHARIHLCARLHTYIHKDARMHLCLHTWHHSSRRVCPQPNLSIDKSDCSWGKGVGAVSVHEAAQVPCRARSAASKRGRRGPLRQGLVLGAQACNDHGMGTRCTGTWMLPRICGTSAALNMAASGAQDTSPPMHDARACCQCGKWTSKGMASPHHCFPKPHAPSGCQHAWIYIASCTFSWIAIHVSIVDVLTALQVLGLVFWGTGNGNLHAAGHKPFNCFVEAPVMGRGP